MKQLLYILLGITLFTSCSSDDNPSFNNQSDLTGKWYLKSIVLNDLETDTPSLDQKLKDGFNKKESEFVGRQYISFTGSEFILNTIDEKFEGTFSLLDNNLKLKSNRLNTTWNISFSKNTFAYKEDYTKNVNTYAYYYLGVNESSIKVSKAIATIIYEKK